MSAAVDELQSYLSRCANLDKAPIQAFVTALREKQDEVRLDEVRDEDTLCIGKALAKSRTITQRLVQTLSPRRPRKRYLLCRLLLPF